MHFTQEEYNFLAILERFESNGTSPCFELASLHKIAREFIITRYGVINSGKNTFFRAKRFHCAFPNGESP